MGLKFRFSLIISLIFVLFISAFSWVVFNQVKKNLLLSSEQSLRAHLEHEWNHILQRDYHSDESSATLHMEDIYHRIWIDGELLHDAFPEGVEMGPSAEVGHQNNKITVCIHREARGSEFIILGFIDLKSTLSYLSTLKKILLLGCLLSMIIVFPLSFVLSRGLLSPFHRLAVDTSRLSPEELSFRFPVPHRRDEYGILIRSFNSLFGRIQRSFEQVRAFAVNVSHELRTPLTVIRGEAEIALRRKRSPQEYEMSLSKIATQAENLQKITNQLLVLADVERIELENKRETISASKLIADVMGTLEYQYKAEGKKIDFSTKPNPVCFQGYPQLFSLVSSNLIENALKFSNSQLNIRVNKEEREVTLLVEDDGPGISKSMRTTVFEPFRKSGKQKGFGIGLSIVAAAVRAQKGKIELGDSPLGGLSVLVRLPDMSIA